MKTTTYKIKYINNNNINTFNGGSNNYSKILDDLILSDIKKENDYLFTTPKKTTNIIINKKPKHTISLLSLINLFKKKKSPIIIDHGITYHFGNIPVTFYDDEVQIGFDFYDYEDLLNDNFIIDLPKEKKDIINININIANL